MLLLTAYLLQLTAHRSCLNFPSWHESITPLHYICKTKKIQRPNSPTTKWHKGSNSNTSIEGGGGGGGQRDQVTLKLIHRAECWEGVLFLGMQVLVNTMSKTYVGWSSWSGLNLHEQSMNVFDNGPHPHKVVSGFLILHQLSHMI